MTKHLRLLLVLFLPAIALANHHGGGGGGTGGGYSGGGSSGGGSSGGGGGGGISVPTCPGGGVYVPYCYARWICPGTDGGSPDAGDAGAPALDAGPDGGADGGASFDCSSDAGGMPDGGGDGGAIQSCVQDAGAPLAPYYPPACGPSTWADTLPDGGPLGDAGDYPFGDGGEVDGGDKLPGICCLPPGCQIVYEDCQYKPFACNCDAVDPAELSWLGCLVFLLLVRGSGRRRWHRE